MVLLVTGGEFYVMFVFVCGDMCNFKAFDWTQKLQIYPISWMKNKWYKNYKTLTM